MFRDEKFYEYLQVSEKAEQEVIESAYRRLARKYHPDNTRGDAAATEKFKKIAEAYDTLREEVSRKRYDEWLCSRRKSSSKRYGERNCSHQKSEKLVIDWNTLRTEVFARYDKWREQTEREEEKQRLRKRNWMCLAIFAAVICGAVLIGISFQKGETGDSKKLAENLKGEANQDSETEADTAFVEYEYTEALAASTSEEKEDVQYIVNASSLNVRKSADADSEKVGKLYKSDKRFGTGNVSEDGSWVEIYYDKDLTGWVCKDYIEMVESVEDENF